MKKSELKVNEMYAVTQGSGRYQREDYNSALRCQILKVGVERRYSTYEGMATYHGKRNDGILVKVVEGPHHNAGEELIVTGRDIWMPWGELEENKARRACEDKEAEQKQNEVEAHETDLGERVAKIINATDTVTVALVKIRHTGTLTGRVSLPTNALEELLGFAEEHKLNP